ncbi:hypothetical protein BP6252_10175 [Coleophoma cylindrospora]|uniref:Fungal lipase-type domain-containing protein n=1 Tax=Coleophoma cylindrospora TaxID=1849047 RepID=A0A3D8QXX2_9HELO|nr:hypothetical protein BP6252_10175 [Coleophoma cylindrospora]
MQSFTLTVLAACLGTATANPLWGRATAAITSAQLTEFELFSQYAGAAYCTNVVQDPATTLIECEANGGACAKVEANAAFVLDSFYQVGSQLTTGYIGIDPTNNLIVVAFQGTPGFDSAQLVDDLEIYRDDTTICGSADTNDSCEIHSGFLSAWNEVQSLVETGMASAIAAYPSYGLVFTGHSMGAAIAAIGAAVERNAGHIIDLYTFGQPRIGSADISNYITNQAPALGGNYRMTDYNDIIPQLPTHVYLFGKDWDHYTPEYYIDINGTDITTADIQVITTPLFSTAGNSGWSLIDSSITAHREYFGYISACS